MSRTTYITFTNTTGAMTVSNEQKMMVHNAVERVCQMLGNVTTEQIWGKTRVDEIVTARQLVMWYLHECCYMSSNCIGAVMGRTHVTVLHAVKKIDTIIELGGAYDKRICEAALLLRKETDELRQDD